MSVASAAVGPASGCETMGTGLRPGCTRWYSCPFRGDIFLLVTPFKSHQQVKRVLLKLVIGVTVSCTTSTFRKSQTPCCGLSALSSVNFLATMSFNLVIPIWDSTRADWKSESAKIEVILMPCNLGVGLCVSRCDMSARSYVDSGIKVSWNGSMCTVSLLNAELAAAPAWSPEFTFSFKTVHDVVHQEVSGPFLPLCHL